MKKNATSRVTHGPSNPSIFTGTDWARVEALTDAEIRVAAKGDVDAQPLPKKGFGHLRKLVNVKKLRKQLGLTQEAFAARYRIPLGTLRDWEQHRKHPDATARAYLMVIARNPAAIAALLRPAA